MITTTKEAESWFLSHSSGSVEVKNSHGEIKECDNYPAAEEWLSQ